MFKIFRKRYRIINVSSGQYYPYKIQVNTAFDSFWGWVQVDSFRTEEEAILNFQTIIASEVKPVITVIKEFTV